MKRTRNSRKKKDKKPEEKSVNPFKSDKKGMTAGIISAILVFLLHLFFWPEKESASLSRFYYFVSASANALLVYIALVQKLFAKKYLKYLFLILLVGNIVSDIVFSSGLLDATKFTNELMRSLAIPLASFGLLSLCLDKEKLQEEISRRFNRKPESAKLRLKAFFSKKNLPYIFAFLLVSAVASFTLSYKIGKFDFYSDEVSVVRGAKGFLETGEYKQWDFVKGEVVDRKYHRARPHQFVVAQAFKLFGFSETAARIPSVVFGIFTVALLFLVGQFFIKDKAAALTAALSLAFFFEFLVLGRWARMYAMLFPMFIAAFYLAQKFFTGYNTYVLFNSDSKPFLKKYLNFDYIYLPFLLILLYISLFTHQNTMLIFPVYYFFVLFAVFLFAKEKKYAAAAIVTTAVLIMQILFPFKVGFGRFTFFEMEYTQVYSEILFAYPFSASTGLSLLAVGIGIFVFLKNDKFRKKYLPLFLLAGLTLLLFGTVFDYAAHFRYVSFAVPLIILTIIGIYFLTARVLFSKFITILLAALPVISSGFHYSQNFEDLYEENPLSPAQAKTAYHTIKEHHKKGEVIFRHWGPKLYLEGISPDTKFISLGSYEGRSFKEVYELMQENPAGWLTWHTQHDARMDKRLKNYANLYFEKHHGYGVDETYTEVFYYDSSMLAPKTQLRTEKFIPTANLSLENDYAICFDLKTDSLASGEIFSFRQDTSILTRAISTPDSLIIKNKFGSRTGISLEKGKNNHVVWYRKAAGGKFVYGFYRNGNFVYEKETKAASSLAKFQINAQYRAGNIDNLRILDFKPKPEQVKAIMKSRGDADAQELEAEGNSFRSLYLWVKKQ